MCQRLFTARNHTAWVSLMGVKEPSCHSSIYLHLRRYEKMIHTGNSNKDGIQTHACRAQWISSPLLNLSATLSQCAADFVVYTFFYSLAYLAFRIYRSCFQTMLFLRVRRSKINTNDLLPPQPRGKENNQ